MHLSSRSPRRLLLTWTACGLVLLGVRARADTLLVPAQHATIQAAVDAALSGDRIEIDPGTYVEDVVVDGKALTLVGVGGPAATTILGTGTSSVVTLSGGDPVGSVLEGLTLRGGIGSPDPGAPGLRRGGGLLALGPSALVDCRLVDNHVSGDGGGAARSAGGVLDPLDMERCLIADNSAGRDGGGIHHASLSSSLVLRDCTLRDNLAGRDGGGFSLRGALNLITGTLIADNEAARDGGGAHVRVAEASSNFAFGQTIALVGNSAGGRGGGAFVTLRLSATLPGRIELAGHSYTGNVAGTEGGGLYMDAAGLIESDFALPALRLMQCSFASNHASVAGGGLWLATQTDELVEDVPVVAFRMTASGNTAPSSPALRLVGASPISFQALDSVIWGHAPSATDIDVAATYEHCDVEGGAPGEGNFDADPLLIDVARGVVDLLPGSPCFGTGVGFGNVGAGDLAWAAARPRAMHGSAGRPRFTGVGFTFPAETMLFHLEDARPLAPAWLVIGITVLQAPFKGGVLVPSPDLVLPGLLVTANGDLDLAIPVPEPEPPTGAQLHWQVWVVDDYGPQGLVASNGLTVTVN